MCSKMQIRPAGFEFSDSELDDDDYVSCQFDLPVNQNNKPKQNNKPQASFTRYDQCVPTYNSYDEEEELQSRAVINACQTGQLNVIQEYLKTHMVNDFLTTGWTLLLYAASCGQVQVIKYLLECGADPNIHRDAYTPLLALCNSTNSTKDTDLECLNLLMKAGANANATSKQRETGLMYACKTKEPAFLIELVKHVNDINLLDGSNKTALMHAVIADRPEIVQLLLDNGADQTSCDNNNLCAIDIAREKHLKKIIKVLDPNTDVPLDNCNDYSVQTWRDFFPTLSQKSREANDFDVSVILWGMGLEKYASCFKGFNLKEFLRLTEEDLSKAGVDISAQRKQYTDCLLSFFKKEWFAQSTGSIKKSSPYTIYDGVITLGVITRHTVIIDASLVYMKHSMTKAYQENPDLQTEEVTDCLLQLDEMKQSVSNIRDELLKLKVLAKKIRKESSIKIPPCHIGPAKDKSPKWCLILSCIITLGMTLSRTSYVQRLWSNLDSKILGSY